MQLTANKNIVRLDACHNKSVVETSDRIEDIKESCAVDRFDLLSTVQSVDLEWSQCCSD